jgi:tetratricopeptide (TPR) repeat protein
MEITEREDFMAAAIRSRSIRGSATCAMVMISLLSVAAPAAAGDPAFAKGLREDSLVSDAVYFNSRTRKTVVVADNDPCYRYDISRNYRKQAAACSDDIGMEEFNRPMLGFGVSDRYYNRGNAYYELREDGKAMADYNKTIELYPGFYYVYNNRGLIYFRQGAYDRAIAEYTQALAQSPDTRPFINRGDAYFMKGDFRNAIADYTQAIRRAPRAFLRNTMIASFRPYRGDQAMARDEYRKAISGAYYKRGLAYRRSGEFEKAAADQKRAIGIMRGSVELPGLDAAEE